MFEKVGSGGESGVAHFTPFISDGEPEYTSVIGVWHTGNEAVLFQPINGIDKGGWIAQTKFCQFTLIDTRIEADMIEHGSLRYSKTKRLYTFVRVCVINFAECVK